MIESAGRSFATLLVILTVASIAAMSSHSAGQATTQHQQLTADRIVISKSERTLILMRDGKTIKTYKIALGGAPRGPKTQQGDHKTPEGLYIIDRRNSNSQFHRALHVSYPNADDVVRARRRHVSPGGDIMIHGLPNGMGWVGRGHLARDWTDGCIAVTDQEIEEIWKLVPNGTPVEIKP